MLLSLLLFTFLNINKKINCGVVLSGKGRRPVGGERSDAAVIRQKDLGTALVRAPRKLCVIHI